ncbi:MAG: pantetheine-phosphate adenylyltransferase [Candidatus Omnitrophica bacterium]|nr:pantetheine-phosphate adenylyltransferase [Candidatus Omnitrophota bacterium]MCM8808596.1 pantetheine-phosphate adenylyltransferase [Candidatus Omnitrophota bacterium]MCM8811127.1 pantetheine-phosphate adenylyltransferase [Candidatus Omnitrophota bacterium]MCM8833406.1 pantetheine-phosphate adenylyltransferase [Candidatus Omnitrophota bacterium]
MKKVGVYPGTFDPITYGHIDVIERSLKIVDEVIIAVSGFKKKDFLFSVEERVAMIKEVFKNNENVKVESFDGLLVDYLKKKNLKIVIRGLRAISDFDYEFQMVLINRKLNKEIETIFLMPREEYFYISSSIVKEIAKLNGNISCFVPKNVEQALRKKFQGG